MNQSKTYLGTVSKDASKKALWEDCLFLIFDDDGTICKSMIMYLPKDFSIENYKIGKIFTNQQSIAYKEI